MKKKIMLTTLLGVTFNYGMEEAEQKKREAALAAFEERSKRLIEAHEKIVWKLYKKSGDDELRQQYLEKFKVSEKTLDEHMKTKPVCGESDFCVLL